MERCDIWQAVIQGCLGIAVKRRKRKPQGWEKITQEFVKE